MLGYLPATRFPTAHRIKRPPLGQVCKLTIISNLLSSFSFCVYASVTQFPQHFHPTLWIQHAFSHLHALELTEFTTLCPAPVSIAKITTSLRFHLSALKQVCRDTDNSRGWGLKCWFWNSLEHMHVCGRRWVGSRAQLTPAGREPEELCWCLLCLLSVPLPHPK